ncbi:outer membrane lipid asymmetry maintenance protein MlaD [Desulfogranum japonicum]|uniref:outer membrane lipid asymmetry maintenance protein MlaD n=1 Tax=Desulfogranum japonicum TaxID=231447 RepID=UPI00042A1F1D|nr:outer membrane lipid asymmetry maintenance protein MlaD [Desulfogranum japonicum]
MRHSRLDIFVGLFLVCGFIAFGWLAFRLGEVPFLTGVKTYEIRAEFSNISGVKAGAEVQISGVNIGSVKELTLNKDGLAVVTMQLDKDVNVPVDSIASVKSQGIIGDKYIQITLGGDEEMYKPGEIILDTESAIDIESLISKFAFGQVK